MASLEALHLFESLHELGPGYVASQVGHLLGLGCEAAAFHHGAELPDGLFELLHHLVG